MGKNGRRPRTDQATDQGEPVAGHVWLRSAPSADGSTYVVTLEVSADRVLTLTPTLAVAYASAVLAAAARADYDAAVLRQLTSADGLGVDHRTAAGLLADSVRPDRPPLPDPTDGMLTLTPGVSLTPDRQLRPFLVVNLDGQPAGQWTPDDARAHAMTALEAVAVADLDAGYYRALIGPVGTDPDAARRVVDNLAEFRIPLTTTT